MFAHATALLLACLRRPWIVALGFLIALLSCLHAAGISLPPGLFNLDVLLLAVFMQLTCEIFKLGPSAHNALPLVQWKSENFFDTLDLDVERPCDCK
eukprot:CAMPEP_0180650692 /NCGR_PEP_ID=MMETSP1037_2-20121125/52396_1 /TAXON_ID=632150 /ORGANISM="Azadinium spinosum, Strain 3D9" /LENGTH=96 /DNA_ID=CAMNT_0022676109 /DNA_START=38 /DNA_END=328 /DNA_ORIENTATION=-